MAEQINDSPRQNPAYRFADFFHPASCGRININPDLFDRDCPFNDGLAIETF